MTKAEIIAKVAENTGITKKDTEKVLNGALEAIRESVAEGDKVIIAGFGSFEMKERAARVGHNPQTGEKIDIPASKTVGFKVAKQFKDTVNA